MMTRCLLVLLIAGLAAAGWAAPVTFRFEAEIETVFEGIPFDSGVDFAEGDLISGRFTFEPEEGDDDRFFTAAQPYDFSLDINGAVLTAQEFNISAINDGPVYDYPTASVIDSLTLGGSGLVPEDRNRFPSIRSSSVFRMELSASVGLAPGLGDALETAMIPRPVDTWNLFSVRRHLILSLRNDQGGSIGFQAAIADFRFVPEPSAASLTTLLVATFSWVYSKRLY